MKARDVMTTQLATIEPDHTVGHAIGVMLENRVSGLPVVEEGRLVGVLTEGDLMRRAEVRRFAGWDYALERREGMAGVARDYTKSHAWCVRDVMTPDVMTVDEDTTLPMIADLMTRASINRVPVVRGNELVGVVSRADILRGIAEAPREEEIVGDAAIRRAVLTRLHAELGLPVGETGATVRDGHVTLYGTAASGDERKAARVAAETVSGVVGVTNLIRLLEPVNADVGHAAKAGHRETATGDRA